MTYLTHLIGGGTFAAMALVAATQSGHAGTVFDGTSGATALTGYITSTDMTLQGTAYHHPGYTLNALIDGDTSTRIDTYSGTEISGSGNNTAPLDFMGVLWASAVSDIVAIRFHQFLYTDGGWFGTAAGDSYAQNNGAGFDSTAANNADAADVGTPTVQVTTDGGATWSSVAATHSYVSIVKPIVQSGTSGLVTTPILFEFAAQSGINGLRLVGYGGGRSDVPTGRDEQGFLAAAEFEVGRSVNAAVPLPAALPALGTALAAFGVVGWRRRRAAAT